MPQQRTVPQSAAWLRTAAVVAPLLVALLLSASRDSISTATDVLVLVAIVVAASATGDRWAGIGAALSSAVWFDFFLTEPYLRFSITDANDIEATVLLLLIGTVVTEVALWGHRQQARASRREGYLEGVLGTAELVLVRHDSVDSLTHRVSNQITEVLDTVQCRFVRGEFHDPEMPILSHDGSVTRRGHPLDVDRGGLPADDEIVRPVQWNGDVVGHFLLNSASQVVRPTVEQRRVASPPGRPGGLAAWGTIDLSRWRRTTAWA